MTHILNIETTTTVASVSLSRNGYTWILREDQGSNDHARHLTQFIQEVLQQADLSMQQLDAIAVSSGPGSYTGLRIGVSVAKGLCYSLDKPLIAVDTLAALAYGVQLAHPVQAKDQIISLQDARRMDAYAAVYNTRLETIKAPFFLTLEEQSFADLSAERLWVAGNAGPKWQASLQQTPPYLAFSSVLAPSAKYMEQLAFQAFQQSQFENLAYYEPFYLKKPHITKAKPFFKNR